MSGPLAAAPGLCTPVVPHPVSAPARPAQLGIGARHSTTVQHSCGRPGVLSVVGASAAVLMAKRVGRMGRQRRRVPRHRVVLHRVGLHACSAGRSASRHLVTRSASEPQEDGASASWWSTRGLRKSLEAAVYSAKSALLGAEWLPDHVQVSASEQLDGLQEDVTKGLENIEASLDRQVEEVQQSVAELESNSFETLADARGAVESTLSSITQLAADTSQEDEAADALPVVPAIEGKNCKLHLEVSPQKAAASMGEPAVEQYMALPMHDLAPDVLKKYYAKGFKADLEVRPLADSTENFEMTIPAVTLTLPLATIENRAVNVELHCRNASKKNGDFTEKGHFDVVLADGKDICQVKLGFLGNYPISAAGWGRTYIGWEHETIQTHMEGDCGIQLMQVPGLRSVMEYFARTTLREAMEDTAGILATSASSAEGAQQ